MEACINQATIMQCPTDVFLKVSHEAGFRNVEFRFQKLEEDLLTHSCRELRRLLEDLRMTAVALNGLDFFSLVPEENYKFTLKKAELLLSVCESLGIGILIVVPSLKRLGITAEEIIQQTAERIVRIQELARKSGVRLALEPVGNPNFSLRTTDEALRVLELARDDSILLALDNICLYEGYNELENIERIPVEKIGVIHANDAKRKASRDYELGERLLPGEGELEVATFYGLLKKMGYVGPVSAEVFSPQVWSLDPKDAAKKAWASIEKIIA